MRDANRHTEEIRGKTSNALTDRFGRKTNYDSSLQGSPTAELGNFAKISPAAGQPNMLVWVAVANQQPPSAADGEQYEPKRKQKKENLLTLFPDPTPLFPSRFASTKHNRRTNSPRGHFRQQE